MLKSASLARVSQTRVAARDITLNTLLTDWRINRFAHDAILRSRRWRGGERVLDVGCGYSPLPQELADRFGVEMWTADDTQVETWSRPFAPSTERDDGVRHVNELVGDVKRSTLPTGYFDVVYSKFGIHTTPCPQDDAWRHMASLLREQSGSEIVVVAATCSIVERHSANAFPILDRVNEFEDRAKRVSQSGVFDSGFWREMEDWQPPVQVSPYAYCAYVMNVLGVCGAPPDELRAERYLFDPDSLFDPLYAAALVACFKRDPAILESVDYLRMGAMLLRFERTN